MLKRKVFEYELPIKIKPEEGGYFVSCPIWSSCYAQGNTIDEAIIEITAVAQSLIDIYKEENLKIPLKIQKTKNFANPFTVPVIVTA